MLGRVQRLEEARGNNDDAEFAAFIAQCEVKMDEGKLDRREFPFVLECLATWREKYGVSFAPRQARQRRW
jgi:hypothetical protein